MARLLLLPTLYTVVYNETSMTQTDSLTAGGRIWLQPPGGDALLGDRNIALLEKIAEFGSISRAARALGLSYKAAWDAVDAINNLTGEPLLVRTTGGRGGGGTWLTEHGEHVVQAYRMVEIEHRRFLAMAARCMDDFDNWYRIFRRLSMKTSARNQYVGKVVAIEDGPVTSGVAVELSGGDRVYATVTRASRDELGLTAGSEVWVLIKASWVILTPVTPGVKLSARNRLCGTVERLATGSVNSDVVIRLKGGNTISAIVTNESAAELGLKKGAEVCAVFKASSVILGMQA